MEYNLKDGKGNIITSYYDNDKLLLFEGEYKNGVKNGRGKEYDYYSGKLLFEEEFLNNEKHGKGKEYDEHGKLIFEGEYLNGEKK